MRGSVRHYPSIQCIACVAQAAFLSLWFSALDTCTSYFTDWLGIMPMQVATTAAVV